MSVTLAILVPCLRRRRWQPLVENLRRQAEKTDAVVFHMEDDGEVPSGVKRQELCELADEAGASYQAFVDDDDEVVDDYVSSLLNECRKGPDVVTFDLIMRKIERPNSHDEVWRFGLWPNNRSRGKMCVNHLCAWKTSIARKVAWCPLLGAYDDHLWFQPLYHAGLVTSRRHVEKSLYYYIYRDSATVNQTSDRLAFSRKYVGDGLKCYRKGDGEILIQHGQPLESRSVTVRDRRNQIIILPSDHPHLRESYHTITVR